MAWPVAQPLWEFPLTLQRNAFTAREVARPGDIWRACQDIAVWASVAQGWGPKRFFEQGTSFVVYRMSVVHDRETGYGEELRAKTWVSRFRRRTLNTREIRIFSDQGPLCAATQDWAHVGADKKPIQASVEVASAYPEYDGGPSAKMPEYEKTAGGETEFSFQMWHTWGDPLGHANHPAYVDWCDESVCRVMNGAGLDPVLLRPVAEQITFKQSVHGGETAVVKTSRRGRTTQGAVVFAHRIELENGDCSADAVTIRTLADGDPEQLSELWKE